MRMGATHFLMKTLPRVATEMALHVLAYNLTRVMNILGIQPLMAAMSGVVNAGQPSLKDSHAPGTRIAPMAQRQPFRQGVFRTTKTRSGHRQRFDGRSQQHKNSSG